MKNQELLVKQLNALMKGDEPEVVEAAMAEIGYLPAKSNADPEQEKAKMEEAITKASADAVEAYKKQVAEVVDLCAVAETPELAGKMVVSGMTREEAQDAIMKAKADAGDNIVSTVSGGAGESVNYLIKDAESRRVK